MERLQAAYGSGTVADAFRTLLDGLFADLTLAFVDAQDPVVRTLDRPIIRRELENAEAHETALRNQTEALEGLGYEAQVSILPGAANVFYEDRDRGRERLLREDGAWVLRASQERLSEEALWERYEASPDWFSANVVLRPVVESAVFPTLAYVGGPGEMAYFAQLGDYFEAHGIRMPVVFPRWAATTVESKIRKVLDKFDLELGRLQQPFHELAGEIARDEMPQDVRAALGKLRGTVAQGVSELQNVTRALDPTLKGPVQHVRSQTFQALDELERKVTQAVKRESEIALSQLEKARVHLYPDGKPAERIHNVFYFLARNGVGFLDALHARFEVELP